MRRELDVNVTELRVALRFRRVESSRAEDRQPWRRVPANLGVERIRERRSRADQLAVSHDEVDQVPVEPGVQS